MRLQPFRYSGDNSLDELRGRLVDVERRRDGVRRALALQLEHGRRWDDPRVVELRRKLRATRVEHALLTDAVRSVLDLRAEEDSL